jgi:hypothetical protein
MNVKYRCVSRLEYFVHKVVATKQRNFLKLPYRYLGSFTAEDLYLKLIWVWS